MDPLMEKELEQAAKRRGITKSQFIIEAVERALGRNNPGELYLKVMEEMAEYRSGQPAAAALPREPGAQKAALRDKLRAKHEQESADYAQVLAARPTGGAA
ncbi:MAG: hypothetical protein AUJ20_01260 [Comamonadaceae bacterium CG1_02_60_18]|nr:MAG: hypothetical protein AUJ20_01260 [Comamonadaceae bacterium CG1_02_60_18]PIQ50994.1 MAG: hypothetical protein COW02_16795 [Comamonadaceae bacterium CG12_big_fil_rev_8_21_14_0_65_59_15]